MKTSATLTLSNKPSLKQAQDLRAKTERTADPEKYFFCAHVFNLLDMSSAAESMRRRGEHYRKLQAGG